MAHPPYSYLTPDTIAMSLQLARELRAAAMTVERLVDGGAMAYNYFGGGGRAGDRATAVKEWVGPHRDTFDSLFQNELDSADSTTTNLDLEADAWARFWATATNARNDRLHDEAMSRYNASMALYQEAYQSYRDAVAEDPEAVTVLRMPSPPNAPGRPVPVSVPTAANYYQPTG